MTTARHLLRAAAAALALVTAGAAAACSPAAEGSAPDAAAGFPLTIENCGEELTIDAEPQTILTVGTSSVSLLDAAGASDRIIARTGEFGAELPADLQNPPTSAEVLDPADPAIETIVGSEADIIVGYGLFNASEDDVAAAGIPNVIIDGECSHDAALTGQTDFEAIFADVERLARIFGTESDAAANLTTLRAELDELTATAPEPSDDAEAAVVYYFSESASLSARGGQGIADDVLARAGYGNVYGDEPSVYLEANIETLLDADPAMIVIAYGMYGESFDDALAKLRSEPGAEDLAAVRSGAVVGVPGSSLAPDPGAIDGLRVVLEGAPRP
ncbi:ABC transporter substrate-binding protein [Microbacterium karelineae]|uniref:ABC transporter substrate-binding protein n=1 Tax=Microbacterium karelineae TaxID=2654283 RepID=UPI0012EA182A|nr:ABC transporter substrate-binding protein [Microbacterium karelineae]